MLCRGIFDDRGDSSATASIFCSGNKVFTAPRQLQLDDVIHTTVDLIVGIVHISVKGAAGNFEFTINSSNGPDLPRGSTEDFWFAAVVGT